MERALHERKRSDSDRKNLVAALEKLRATKDELRQVDRTGADSSMAHLNKQARKAVRTVLAVVKDEIHDDGLFAKIEERVHDALQPGQRTN